ncbi:hypothetical protein K491DRAFT_672984 [Lophiostoma macrostomum CBS 122681]|uniref:Uncharacterized protein n=1 Tax=Lophiostoma macrostomum CBS 122681 TaxID=1314788 RepID=A0A6A6TQZ3_9PLEO|nr:hypothetical protein K491DRAFT_672984 [Lophiostoma macrostomum CBS 122681]
MEGLTPEPAVLNIGFPLFDTQEYWKNLLAYSERRFAELTAHATHYNFQRELVDFCRKRLEELQTSRQRSWLEVIISMGFALSLPDHEPNQIVLGQCKEKLKTLEDEMKTEENVLIKRMVEMFVELDRSLSDVRNDLEKKYPGGWDALMRGEFWN